MKTELECIPCIARQTVDYARSFINDTMLQNTIIKSVLNYLYNASLNVPPPELGKNVYGIVRDLTKISDPFKKIKLNDNQIVLNMYPHLKSLIYKNSNPLETAVKLAIEGNTIDYGANPNEININDIYKDVNKIKLRVNHLDSLLNDLNDANHVLYIADNAGELVFDKLFIEMLQRFYIINGYKITVVVRGKPIINDATKEDAHFIGMNEVATVIDNGDDTPGTLIKYCSPEMKNYFDNADLIISKGQGNYETLDTENKLIYFLLKIKCPVIAKHLAVREGDSILKCNRYN